MEFITVNSGTMTPATEKHKLRSNNQNSSKFSENFHPKLFNVNSPASKSVKSASNNQNSAAYLPQKIRQRKFLKTRTNVKKQDDDSRVTCSCIHNHYEDHGKNCLCAAHENLIASQDEFSKNCDCNNQENGDHDQSKASDEAEIVLDEVIETSLMIHDLRIEDDYQEISNLSENINPVESESPNQRGSSTLKRRRAKLLEEARNSLPEYGRVKHLVEAFEKLLSISKAQKQEAERTKKTTKWALPGLQRPKAPATEATSSSSFSLSQSDLVLTSQNLGLDPQNSVFTSWDSSGGSCGLWGRISHGNRRRSRRNSLESSRTSGGSKSKKHQLKVTSQKPFKLRTEERGKMKEEKFMKKLQETLTEEQKQRVPIAQGLPSTTNEPEYSVKPKSVVQESTRPMDLKLHSDLRAIDRAEFDHQVAEKMSLWEQYKMERERQKKLAEEEEIRRLRKELIPKAQPMPCFDRPFIPRRSTKPPTIPRDPKFHIPQHKKSRSCHL